MTALHVLRVFLADDGSGGNALGVVLDGPAVPAPERQALAAELGFSETVFVDDAMCGEVRIFTPGAELPFAGHPSVGTAWLLGHEGRPVDVLRPPAGDVPVRQDGEAVHIAGRPGWAPEFEFLQLDSAAAVEAVEGPPAGHELAAVWAWEDEPAGRVRARVFPVALGIEEDEATGAAAVRLGGMLRRDLRIRQGRGSVLLVHPRDDGMVEVGGRVALDEVRELANYGAGDGGSSPSQ